MIYISHRLEELPQIADRVTVLRDGAYVATRRCRRGRPRRADPPDGRPRADGRFPEADVPIGESVLEIARTRVAGASGVRGVNLTVRAGEILGLAGLVGAGRTELARVLFGLTPADAGQILLRGKAGRDRQSPRQAIGLGIAYVPEDRRRHGVILDMPVARQHDAGDAASVSRPAA